jgi:hypothetical protein
MDGIADAEGEETDGTLLQKLKEVFRRHRWQPASRGD